MRLHQGHEEQHNSHQCIDQICFDIIDSARRVKNIWKQYNLSCEKIRNLDLDGLKLMDIAEKMRNLNNAVVNSLNENTTINIPYNPLVE
jgi:hypothetical protein